MAEIYPEPENASCNSSRGEPQQPMDLEHLPLQLAGGHATAPFSWKSPEWILCSTAWPGCENGSGWLGLWTNRAKPLRHPPSCRSSSAPHSPGEEIVQKLLSRHLAPATTAQ